ncbi:protoporphyrinogen oxidase [Plasmodium falciparum Palo Alto/Uganda]|uniref:Protoporphyrinogen oxidase n=2 Tax=Plasmodium falciparum TaxID=5833 RepID=W4J414_PLAFP|nr:protoporphyrinogen oxidase [Plasmodium falciparum Palo Alto/Uganda]ETW61096.1 protoporphyrinogen oxidase [Plasmodium falciparum CAMP/Malaysia]
MSEYKKYNVPSHEIYDVILIGGGLFNCCLYYYLKLKNSELSIIIVEKEENLGGYIKTYTYNIDDKKILVELGPNMFKLCNESYNLINKLNLLSSVRLLDDTLIRYIYIKNDKLYPLYLNIFSYLSFPLINISNKIKLLFKLIFKQYKNLNSYTNDISVENYMNDNFDSQHYNFLLLPFIYGSCAGNGKISAVSFFSRNLKLFHNKVNSLYIWNEKIKSEEKNRNIKCVNNNTFIYQHMNKKKKNFNLFTPCYNFFYISNKNMKMDVYLNVLYNYYSSNKKTEKKNVFNYICYRIPILLLHMKQFSINIFRHISIFLKCTYQFFYPFLMLPDLAKWTTSHFDDEKKKKKNLIGKTVTFKNGLYELIDKLQSHMNKEFIYTNHEVDFIEKAYNNLWMCNIKHENQNKTIYGKNIVLAVNSKICSNIMRNILPVNIRDILLNFSYSSIISISLYFKKSDINIPKNFFGFLSSDKCAHILGCFHINNMFKERCHDDNKVLLTLYMGGSNHPNDITLDEYEIKEIISNDLKNIFDIYNDAQPNILKIHKWKDAIPFYSHNYEKLLKKVMEELNKLSYKNLYLDSGWITGTSISDRIRSAQDLCEYIFSLTNLAS